MAIIIETIVRAREFYLQFQTHLCNVAIFLERKTHLLISLCQAMIIRETSIEVISVEIAFHFIISFICI